MVCLGSRSPSSNNFITCLVMVFIPSSATCICVISNLACPCFYNPSSNHLYVYQHLIIFPLHFSLSMTLCICVILNMVFSGMIPVEDHSHIYIILILLTAVLIFWSWFSPVDWFCILPSIHACILLNGILFC